MEAILFLIGACFGSFYLVIGTRLPKNENSFNSRSKCDNCHKVLKWWQLVPVISYICLRGKCFYCHKKISILNPIIEIVTGGVFAYAYLHYGFGYDMYMFIIVSSLLIVIFISDFLYMIINDSPLIVASVLTFGLKWYYQGIKSALLCIVTGIAMFAIMYLFKIIGDKMFDRESLGGGDIKFAFVIGVIVGYKLGLVTLILSCFLALPYSVTAIMLKKNNEVPYGPFLASSLFIVFTFAYKFENLLNTILINL